MDSIRHFTVTAFVALDGATLLHWHRKVGLWLPPGGHIEANETPEHAALRETLEETGLHVQILPTAAPFDYDDPPQLITPAAMMLEPIGAYRGEPAHQHMDFIFFTRPLPPSADERSRTLPRTGSRAAFDAPLGAWRWAPRQLLADNAPLTLNGAESRVSRDVRVLGIAAIDHETAYAADHADGAHA